MDREKQIEEMAKVIDKSPWKLDQDFAGCHINSFEIAESLYNAGYRNQSEVAMEIFEEIYKLTYRLSNDEHYTIGDMIWDIDELKKKYTDINQRKEDEGK